MRVIYYDEPLNISAPLIDPRQDTRRSKLAVAARQIASGADVLYHGTTYASAILASGRLRASSIGHTCVCFTRCADEAQYWAHLGTRGDDDRVGAIFVFDRRILRSAYKLEPYNDYLNVEQRHEREERVWNRDVEISSALIGFVSDPKAYISRSGRLAAYCDKLLTAMRMDPSGGRLNEVQKEFLLKSKWEKIFSMYNTIWSGVLSSPQKQRLVDEAERNFQELSEWEEAFKIKLSLVRKPRKRLRTHTAR